MPERFGYNPEAEGQNPQQENANKGAGFKSKRKLYVIDVSHHLEQEARDAAEAKLTADVAEIKGWKNLPKRVWKYNLWREFYRQRELASARKKMKESQNLFAVGKNAAGKNAAGKNAAQENIASGAGADSAAEHEQEMNAIIERFAQEYDNALRQNGNEKKSEQKEEFNDPVIKAELRALICDYAEGKINNQDAFEEEKVRIFSRIKGANKELIGRGELYASNILEMAKEAKAAVDHGRALDALDLDFDLIIGRAKSAVRTEANFNKVDKIVEKLKNSWAGCWVNETTLAGGVAIAYTLAVRGSQSGISRAFGWSTFGVAAGVGSAVAAAKESARLEEERRLHGREMAKGKKFEAAKSPRRAEMEQYRAETKGANELASALEDISQKAEQKNLSEEEFRAALLQAGEVQARVSYGDQHGIDLIHYSDARKTERENTRLSLALEQAKVRLRELVQNMPGAANLPIDFEIQKQADLMRDIIVNGREGEEGLEKKNLEFKKMKQKQVGKAAARAFWIGLGIGAAAQELLTVPLSHGHQEGVIGAALDWIRGKPQRVGQHYTPLGGFVRWLHGEAGKVSPAMHEVNFAGHDFKIPLGYSLTKDHASYFNLMRGNEIVAAHIANAHGDLAENARRLLAEHGMTATNTTHASLVGAGTEHGGAPYQHMEHIKHDMWFDNDTKAFDKNELRLWGTGHGGPAVNAHGDYVYDISHMTPDGSYHAGLSVDAQELMHQGKLSLAVSVSRNSQNYVFKIPIQHDGQIVFKHDSPLAHLLFGKFKNLSPDARVHLEHITHGYHFKANDSVFKGAYAEVVQTTGVDKAGVEHIRTLATDVGANSIKNPGLAIKQFSTTIIGHNADYRIDPPLWLPIMGRTPLEPTYTPDSTPNITPSPTPTPPEPVLSKPEPYINPYAYGYGGYGYEGYGQFFTEKNFEKFRAVLSRTLRENPDADLDQYSEIKQYLDRLSPEHKKMIREISAELPPMKYGCRMSIMIPVAGHQESKNIYRTLETYTSQTDMKGQPLDPSLFEIVLFVNNPETHAKTGALLDSEETLAEIQRFKKDNPKLNIRVFHRKLPNDEIENGKNVIGKVRRILADAVLMRQMARGRKAPELIVVTNDADTLGISPRYVSNFLDKFDKNPEADSFVGHIDWDPEFFARDPASFLDKRFEQNSLVYERIAKKPIPTSGANTALRASILSAVGGFDPSLGKGEDVNLGLRIVVARAGTKKHSQPIRGTGTESIIYTSTRRMNAAKEKGINVLDQWSPEIEWGAFDELRTKEFAKTPLPNLDDEKEVRKIIDHLEETISKSPVDTPAKRQALESMGVEFEPTPNGVKITNREAFAKWLKKYQQKWKEDFERRTGKKAQILETSAQLQEPQASQVHPVEKSSKKESILQQVREAKSKAVQQTSDKLQAAQEGVKKKTQEVMAGLDPLSRALYKYLTEAGYSTSRKSIEYLKSAAKKVANLAIAEKFMVNSAKKARSPEEQKNDAIKQVLHTYAEQDWKLTGKDMESVANMDFPFRGNISEDLLELDKILNKQKGFVRNYISFANYVRKNPGIAARMLKSDIDSWIEHAYAIGAKVSDVAKIFVYSQILDRISRQINETKENVRKRKQEAAIKAFEQDVKKQLEKKIDSVLKTGSESKKSVDVKIKSVSNVEIGKLESDIEALKNYWPYAEIKDRKDAKAVDNNLKDLAEMITSERVLGKFDRVSKQLGKMHAERELAPYHKFVEIARMDIQLTGTPEKDINIFSMALKNHGFLPFKMTSFRNFDKTAASLQRRIESLLQDAKTNKEKYDEIKVIKLLIFQKILEKIRAEKK